MIKVEDDILTPAQVNPEDAKDVSNLFRCVMEPEIPEGKVSRISIQYLSESKESSFSVITLGISKESLT